MTALIKPLPDWEEHEKPSLPGSASMPWHAPHVRLAYAGVALLIGITGGLGNALVSVNLPAIQGQLGLTPAQGLWLPAAYAMMNVSANLLLYKCRQQFGLRLFTEIGLGAYALLCLLHLAAGNLESAILLRAASGIVAALVSSLTYLYMLQAAPRQHTGRMLMLGLGVTQLGTPLAWLLSPALLDFGQLHSIYLFEAGLALCTFAAVMVLKLPPGIQIRVFERLDLLTFALLAPALALLVVVLSQGLNQGWLDAPWLAWLLVAALLLLAAAFLLEHHRANPLIQTRWLCSADMLRFTVGAFLLRFLTTEQSYGAVGMLRTLGMGPDQMQPLFAVVLAGAIAGTLLTAALFSRQALPLQFLLAIALFGAAGLLDYGRTSLDRPQDFFLSQFLLAMGAGIFMGPLLLGGFMRALPRGANHVVSLVLVISISQTLGGVAGTALLGTYQLHREHEYSTQIVAEVNAADAMVAQRLRQQQQAYSATIADPVLRSAQGSVALSQIARREANVLAFNDVFALTSLTAMLFLLWSLFPPAQAFLKRKLSGAPAA